MQYTNGSVVHRLERFSDKEEVDGSIPSRPTRMEAKASRGRRSQRPPLH